MGSPSSASISSAIAFVSSPITPLTQEFAIKTACGRYLSTAKRMHSRSRSSPPKIAALPESARQERHRREAHGCPRRSQAVKAAHVHAVRNVRTGARTVKDDDGAAHKGQRAPDARHAAAAVRAAYADALNLNSHSAPPVPRAPRTPSASARSASHSYRLPVRARHSAAPVPTPARRR